MRKKVCSCMILLSTSALPALAETKGVLSHYCETMQRLGDGSWSTRGDMKLHGMSYPANTVFVPGMMTNRMDMASQFSQNCVK